MDASYYKKYEPVFGEYYIREQIGRGSYGRVFLIEREDMGTVYRNALKVITIPREEDDLETIRIQQKDPSKYCLSFVNRIKTEVELMSSLKGNSNIVSYENHKFIQHDDGIGWDILIQMELLTPIFKYIRSHPLSREDVIRIGIDICKGLELCHDRNIIHRDVKPENIFVSDVGNFKLGDFGIAKISDATSAGTIAGTPSFMAPEVYNGKQYNATVDTYSLGITLYTFLNNHRVPFEENATDFCGTREAANTRRFSGEPIPPIEGLDDGFNIILLKACAFNAESRFPSAKAMREALENLLAGSTVGLDYKPEDYEEPTTYLSDHTGQNNSVNPQYSNSSYFDSYGGSTGGMSMQSGTDETVAGAGYNPQAGRGPAVNSYPRPAAAPVGPADGYNYSNNNKKNRNRIIIIITVAVIVLAGIFGVYLLRSDGGTESEVLTGDSFSITSWDWDWNCYHSTSNSVDVIMIVRNDSDEAISGIAFNVREDGGGYLRNDGNEYADDAPLYAEGYIPAGEYGVMVANIRTGMGTKDNIGGGGQPSTGQAEVVEAYTYEGDEDYVQPEGTLVDKHKENGATYDSEISNDNDWDVSRSDCTVVAVYYDNKSEGKLKVAETCANGMLESDIPAGAQYYRENGTFMDPDFDGYDEHHNDNGGYYVYVIEQRYQDGSLIKERFDREYKSED